MRIIVHIGFHKTGTSSIQRFMGSSRETLRSIGIDYFSGRHIVDSHAELHVAAMRTERLSPFKVVSRVRPDNAYIEATRAEIGRFLDCSRCETAVFSGEGLSYLRYDDEIDRLRYLMHNVPVEIVCFKRNPIDWRASYVAELLKNDIPEVLDSESFAYLGTDSWLLDFDRRLELFRRSFSIVHELDYDRSVSQHGSVVGVFLDVLGCGGFFEQADWSGIWDNAR